MTVFELKDDYVSYETAKILKEKGFPQDVDNHSIFYITKDVTFENTDSCNRTTFEKGSPINLLDLTYNNYILVDKCNVDDFIFCPNLYLVDKFLIKNNIHIDIHYTYNSMPPVYNYRMFNYNRGIINYYVCGKSGFRTKEDAWKDAIDKAIELL